MMPGRQCPVFLAAFENGYTLARIETECRIEGVLYLFKLQQFLGGELTGHFAQFFDAYPVLSCDAAAGAHLEFKNFPAELLRFANLSRITGVEQDERM